MKHEMEQWIFSRAVPLFVIKKCRLILALCIPVQIWVIFSVVTVLCTNIIVLPPDLKAFVITPR